jgi:type II secretory pathway component PulF
MPRFSYTAINGAHKSVRGAVTAENSYAARKHLRAKGLHPTDVKQVSMESEGGSGLGFIKKTGKRQITEFTRQFSILLKAGIKLTEALSVLINQVSDKRLKNAVTDIRDRVVTGESLADSMSEYEMYFDVIYISMVRVGEITGTLDSSLERIAEFMERRQKLESKMATIMIYPAILMTACVGAVIVLTVTVIPTIAEVIKSSGQEMPGITQALVGFSRVLTSWRVLILIAVIAALFWIFRKLLQTEKGGYYKDKVSLCLPLFGPLLKQRIVARFCSTLSTLLGSGLSMAEALKVVSQVTGNRIMQRAVNSARDRILSGADIATPLRESGVIDPTVAHMVTVGEKSGELETMLKTISDNLESSSDIVIDRFSAAIEPIIIIIMAVVIGTIAYAILLPIIRMSAGQL